MLPKHRVSAKGAFYSHDLKSVLIMRYSNGIASGLPGGHVEKYETPDEALLREVKEELSLDLSPSQINRRDFFKNHKNEARIILGYTAVIPADAFIKATDPKREYGEWVSKVDINEIPNMPAEYKRFVLENWPTDTEA